MQTFQNFDELYRSGGGGSLSMFNDSRRESHIVVDPDVVPRADVFGLGYPSVPHIRGLAPTFVENGILDWVRGFFGGKKQGSSGESKAGAFPQELPDVPVTSSYLRIVGYDPGTSKLVVEFQDGALIEYGNVSESEYRDMLGASSHGQYFYYNIRDDYPWRMLHRKHV